MAACESSVVGVGWGMDDGSNALNDGSDDTGDAIRLWPASRRSNAPTR